MPINPKKLEAAFRRAKRVKVPTVPASLEMALEKLLANRHRHIATLATDAALKKIPNPSKDSVPMITDAVPPGVVAAVNGIYQQYSGITKLSKQLKEQYDKTDTFHRKAWLRTINGAIGISVADLLSDKRAKAVVNLRLKESVSLIKSLDVDMKRRILKEIGDGIAMGSDTVDIRKMILENPDAVKPSHRKRLKLEYRARLIARDQTGKLFANLEQTRQEDIGVTEYVWSTVGDGAVRSSHAARDGKTFKWSDPPEGGHPGTEVQCRCTAEPNLKTAKIAQAIEAAA